MNNSKVNIILFVVISKINNLSTNIIKLYKLINKVIRYNKKLKIIRKNQIWNSIKQTDKKKNQFLKMKIKFHIMKSLFLNNQKKMN